MKYRFENTDTHKHGFVDYVLKEQSARLILEPGQSFVREVDELLAHSKYITAAVVPK